MARLPLIDPETATGEVAAAFAAAPVKLNIFRMLAHAETCMVPQMQLGAAILSRQLLGHRLRELLILLVAKREVGRVRVASARADRPRRRCQPGAGRRHRAG